MGQELQYGYFGHIAKFEKTEDGTLMVYGKAAGADLDLDGQRCDPVWLKTAMPSWHEWGNVREQHANIAAGVGVELTEGDGGDWWLKAEIVDPNTIRKVEKRVLKGFSVGIVNGRVIKSKLAPNGVIDDGTIAEISLVDRPCNPQATMSIAKSAGTADAPLEPVEAEEVFTSEGEVPEAVVATTPDTKIDIQKSAGWYREALRTVEDVHGGAFDDALRGRTLTKGAASEHEEANEANISAAIDAADRVLDLIISEANEAKGGRFAELRDIEVLLSAAHSLCRFVECEQDHGGYDEDGDDAKAYMASGAYAKAAGGVDTGAQSTVVDETAGEPATVVPDTTDLITKAVQAAQAEFGKAHEAELATLRADLEKALAAPKPGGPVTFKRVIPTSSAPAQDSEAAAWRAKAANPSLAPDIARAYLAKAVSLEGASQ